jgi:hypothetical protein
MSILTSNLKIRRDFICSCDKSEMFDGQGLNIEYGVKWGWNV